MYSHKTHSNTIPRLSLAEIFRFGSGSVSDNVCASSGKARADWRRSASFKRLNSTSSSSPPMSERGVFGVLGEIWMALREEVTAMRSLDLLLCITWILAVSVLSRGDLLVSIFHAQWLTRGSKEGEVKNKPIFLTRRSSVTCA
jgi:hypothetical protein